MNAPVMARTLLPLWTASPFSLARQVPMSMRFDAVILLDAESTPLAVNFPAITRADQDFCSMCGPKFCSMKITQEVRDFAAAKGLTHIIKGSKLSQGQAVNVLCNGGNVITNNQRY